MTARDIPAGTPFRFKGGIGITYIARGGGWYGSPGGYDGGPWCDVEGRQVEGLDGPAAASARAEYGKRTGTGPDRT